MEEKGEDEQIFFFVSSSLNSNGLLKTAWENGWDGYNFSWRSASWSKFLIVLNFFSGHGNNWFFFLHENRAQWKQVKRKNLIKNYRSLIASLSTFQPNPFSQLMSFCIKYATKNPSGHCMHFKYYSTARQRASKGLTAQIYLKGRNYLLPPRTKRGVHL